MTGKIIYKHTYKTQKIIRQYPVIAEIQADIEDILCKPLTAKDAIHIQEFIKVMVRFLYIESKENWPLENPLFGLEHNDYLEVTYPITIYDVRATLKKLITLPDNEIRLKILQSSRFAEFETFIRNAIAEINTTYPIGGLSALMYEFSPMELRQICKKALDNVLNEKKGGSEKVYYDYFFTMIFELWTNLGQKNISIHDSSEKTANSSLVRFSHLLAQKIENRTFHTSHIRKKLTEYRKLLNKSILGDS